MDLLRSLKKPLVILALTSAGSLLAARALAGDYGHDERRGYDRENGSDYAEVVDVDPLVREVRVSEPRQECREETRYDSPRRYSDRPAGGQMILGGLIGAVIGHQFGYGHARSNATIAGAVIGSAVGHDSAQRSRPDRDYDGDYRRPITEQRCRTRYDERYERQVDGYRVTYRYNGRLYTTQLPYDPGERLPVRVTVEPWRRGG